MADRPPLDPGAEDRHRRGLAFRRRDDHAIELFREAEAHLADLECVKRVLIQLGRFYNPLIDGPIVDLETRRRIVESLEAGRTEDARRLLDERLALYARSERDD